MAGTRTTRITAGYGTTSDERGENLESPQDASDVLGMESEIGGKGGSAPRRSPMGGLDIGRNADPGKGIDLRKRPDIDLRKRPDIDLSKSNTAKPGIGIDISKSEAGNLGIGVEIPIPVPAPVSARGKIAIDPATGKIRGGGLGLGLGKGLIGISIDVGVDTPPGSEKLGCFKYVTVSLSIFSHTFGKNECEPKITKIEEQPEKPTIISPPGSPPPVPDPPNLSCSKNMLFWKSTQYLSRDYYNNSGVAGSSKLYPNYQTYTSNDYFKSFEADISDQALASKYGVDTTNFKTLFRESGRPVRYYSYSIGNGVTDSGVGFSEIYGYNPFIEESYNSMALEMRIFGSSYLIYGNGTNIDKIGYKQSNYAREIIGYKPNGKQICGEWQLTYEIEYKLVCGNNNAPFSLSFSPPIPNPQPIKKKMDKDCCKIMIALQIETLRQLGCRASEKGVAPVTGAPGLVGEKIKRTETPITDGKRPKTIEITFSTLYEMLAYALKQANDLDTALDPKSYKIPEGYIQNPEYNRDSGDSLKENNQPNKDKAGNDRELEINESDKAKMGGFLEQQQYMFEAIKRLEYLFPFGELSDAKIDSGLLIPGKKGEIKIHNMIMAYEILIQYINATLGNPKENLIIKDANPAIAGDQPIEVKALTISDWMRQIVRFQVDTGGDVDAMVNLMLRDFRTNLANRTDIVKTAEMVQALFEDSGMRENQDYIALHLEGDPYAGQWVKGEGFKPNPDLEKKTEEATEKVLRETMKPTDIKIKVSRRHKDEKTDMRDLLRGLADFIQRLLSIPSSGDAAKSIDKLIESAKFKVQTDMALIRQNVAQAATASRNRTKKRKK